MTDRTVILAVECVHDNHELVQVLEVLSRTMAGLIMDGADVRLYSYTEEGANENVDGV